MLVAVRCGGYVTGCQPQIVQEGLSDGFATIQVLLPEAVRPSWVLSHSAAMRLWLLSVIGKDSARCGSWLYTGMHSFLEESRTVYIRSTRPESWNNYI